MPKFEVVQSTVIDAPAERVFTEVRNFRSWPTWSPWLISEPTCKLEYQGTDGYSWEGEVIGSGRMDLQDAAPSRSLDMKLTFLKPWKSISAVRFDFSEAQGGTKVVWKMQGSMPWFLFWMKKMMIGLIGMDYQRGLAMLKDVIETGENPSKLDIAGPGSANAQPYVGVRTSCAIADIASHMERDMKKLRAWLDESGTKEAGPPFTIYHNWAIAKGVAEYTAAAAVATKPTSAPSGFVTGERVATPVYQIRHTGPYRHLRNAWAAGMMHGQNKVFRPNRKIHPFEVYENDPTSVPPEEATVVVNFPMK